MADKKKKFSLNKGKESKGFNVSKGDKSASGFILDKGADAGSSKKIQKHLHLVLTKELMLVHQKKIQKHLNLVLTKDLKLVQKRMRN